MSSTIPGPRLQRLTSISRQQLNDLAALLHDCVHGGASVSFMLPFPIEKALQFWEAIAVEVASGARALLVAEDGQGIVGTVQLVLALPENQPHRADVSKMLVHRRARRQGMGEALMKAVEATALECGRTLLVLDTASQEAERLYVRQGWQLCGVIPDYALMPDGALCDTKVFYKRIGG